MNAKILKNIFVCLCIGDLVHWEKCNPAYRGNPYELKGVLF